MSAYLSNSLSNFNAPGNRLASIPFIYRRSPDIGLQSVAVAKLGNAHSLGSLQPCGLIISTNESGAGGGNVTPRKTQRERWASRRKKKQSSRERQQACSCALAEVAFCPLLYLACVPLWPPGERRNSNIQAYTYGTFESSLCLRVLPFLLHALQGYRFDPGHRRKLSWANLCLYIFSRTLGNGFEVRSA